MNSQRQRILKAGAGRGDIVFPKEYFPQETFWGVRGTLHARALLLEQTEVTGEENGAQEVAVTRFLLIQLELPSLRPFELIDELRTGISTRMKVPRENLWLCVTHDLSAPHVPDPVKLPEKFEMHMQSVRDGIEAACHQARDTLREAYLGIGTGVSHISANRDVQTRQGWVMGIHGTLPVDPGLTAIRFETPEGEPIAFLYQYAIKSSVIEMAQMPMGTKLASPEVTGLACERVEQKYGAPTIFLMGAGGDQVPREKARYWAADEKGDAVMLDYGMKAYEMLDRLAEEFGEDLLGVIGGIRCSRGESGLELRHLVWTYPGQGDYRGLKTMGGPIAPYEYVPADPEDLEVEVLRLGKAVFLGLKPECTASVGLRLKELCAGKCDRIPLLTAMVNGGKGYLADEASYDHYTHAGTGSVFARGSAERFAEQAAELVCGM